MYYQGLGVEKDIKKAWPYLERSLNFGNNDTRYLFATMCFNNELQGVIPDIYGREEKGSMSVKHQQEVFQG